MIYVIGSLRNPQIPIIANRFRDEGFEVFDEWYAPGPRADDHWQAYEKKRGHSYAQAIAGWHAQNVFHFDYRHLKRADVAVMVMPAGKSGHLELGWMAGQGKCTYVLFDKEPDRYDVMYQFCTGVFFSLDALVAELIAREEFNDGDLR